MMALRPLGMTDEERKYEKHLVAAVVRFSSLHSRATIAHFYFIANLLPALVIR
jgi:hypothetical protein